MKGYDIALALAAEKLEVQSPDEVCARCGVIHRDGEYFIPWFGTERSLSSGSVAQRIIWMHYLIIEGAKKPTDEARRYMAYREIEGSLFYESKYVQRAVKPFIAYFGRLPEALEDAGRLCGGKKADVGDLSVTINALPFVPLTFVLWAGDEEFPPDGSILFDETAKGWLCSEDAVVLAGMAVSELIAAHKGMIKKKGV